MEAAGARCAASQHWAKGGEGALELADAVLDACKEEVNFQYLYPVEMKLRDRVELIAKEVYGADGVAWLPEAEAKSKQLEADPKFADYATMMVKTHLSLSHDPALKGVPKAGCCPFATCWCIRARSFSAPAPAPSA